MTPLPCRRCGENGENMTVIYGPDPAGALQPRAAEHRGRCPSSAAPPSRRPRRRDKLNVVTASRPAKCGACEWDVIPGDRAVRTEAGLVHLECAPAQAS